MRISVLLLAICLSCHQKETKVVQREAPPADSVAVDSIRQTETAAEVVGVRTPLPEIEILFTGTFHSDEIKENTEALAWLGLFTDENGNFTLTETKVFAHRVFDGLLDDEASGDKTGWEIATENDQHPVILVSGGYFKEGTVEAAQIPGAIYPGDSVQLEFKGVHYLLYATGFNVVDSAAGINHVSDYSLFVVRTHNGESAQASLATHASFDDAMTSVLWSGDIDSDGYMDFIIDMSRHYNQRLPTLFLSKPAKDNQVVVPVAEHSSVGC